MFIGQWTRIHHKNSVLSKNCYLRVGKSAGRCWCRWWELLYKL